MPLQTSMAPSVPLSLISEDQHQPPMRGQYTYVPSSTAPRQLPMTASPQSGTDSASSVPRYVDDGRPAKTSRNASHHSGGSVGNSEAHSDYRYGSYAPVNNGGEVIPPNYGAESSTSNATSQRDVYSSSQGWRTTAGEQSATVAYAGNDGRAYASSYDQYKNRPADSQVKSEPGQTSHPDAYGVSHRGSFDGLANYSWSNS